MLRRIRAALVLGVLWGIAWVPFWLVFMWSYGLPLGIVVEELLVPFSAISAVSGAIFGGILTLFERRGAIDRLVPARVAAWGAAAGAVFPTVLTILILAVSEVHGPLMASALDWVARTAPISAFGAFCGWATLWLAQRGREDVAVVAE